MTAEFAIPIAISELPPGGTTVTRRADGAERAKLAERLGLSSLDKLEISVRLTHQPRGLRAEGQLRATVVQPCSVTLDPIVTKLDLPVRLDFEHAEATEPVDLQDVDVEMDDPPEPIFDGAIDLGETLVQLMAVEIDPFPRKPDLPYEDFASGPKGRPTDGTAADANPFAALAALKNKLDEG